MKNGLPSARSTTIADSGAGKLTRDELLEHAGGLRRRQGPEPERRRIALATAPGGPAVEQLRAPGSENEERPPHVADEAVDQVEQRLLGPVQILDEDDRRPVGDELAEKLDPRLVQAVPHGERVESAHRLQPERQSETLAGAEQAPNRLGRCVLLDAEVLLEDLPERPVRDPSAIRYAAACQAERFGQLGGEHGPELAHEARLANPGIAHDRHAVRLALTDDTAIGRLE